MFGTRIQLMADFHNSHSGVGLAAVVTAGVVAVAGSTQWTFGNLVGDPPKITMMNRHNARGWTCQRVLSAVRNAVIDVKACAFKISDQGVQAADKIAAKATQ